MFVSPAMGCRPLKVETCLSTTVSWDMLQPSVTPQRISGYGKWMDGCLMLFVLRGSMTQRSTSGTVTGMLEANSLFYQSFQTSQNNLTSQLSQTCHFSFHVCLSDWGHLPPPPPPQSKKQDLNYSRQGTLNNT